METLFRHNTWANLKLLDFSTGLSDDQLRATATCGKLLGIRRLISGNSYVSCIELPAGE